MCIRDRPGAGCAYGGAALRAARADSRCGDKRSVADGIGRVANRRFQKAQTEMRKRTWLRQGEVMRMAIPYSRTLLGLSLIHISRLFSVPAIGRHSL